MSQTPIVSNAEVNIRRAPKYLHFALTGFVLGIFVALVLGLSSPEIVGLLIVFGGMLKWLSYFEDLIKVVH